MFRLPRDVLVSAAFVAILVVTSLSLLSGQRTQALLEREEGAQLLEMELKALESDLKDVETGARGYVITGDFRYLEPFREGASRVTGRLAALRSLSYRENAGALRLDRLGVLAQERLAAARRLIDMRRQGNSPSAGDLEAGRRLMDAVRDEVARLVQTERNVFARHRQAVRHQQLFSMIALLLGVLLSLAVLAAVYLLRNREAADREQVEAGLRAVAAGLEDRVKARTRSLRQSRELLIAIVEGMPDTVFLKEGSEQGHLRYVLINRAGEELIGRTRDEIVGRTDEDLFPDFAASWMAEDHEVLAGRPLPAAERSIATPNGPKTVEVRKFVIPGSESGDRFVLGVVRDVTEGRRLEEQLRQVQRMDAIGHLTGGIAHDFNNLLAIIIGNIEILEEQLEDSGELKELSGAVLGAATRGAELVRRMLAFARRQHLQPQPVDLNQRLPSIVALLRRVMRDDVEVRVVPEEGLAEAFVDPTQVDDALVNLAVNARDAMPEGGTLTIETANVVLDEVYASAEGDLAPGRYVMLAVSDTGTGMTAETAARAFEPFFTTKDVGKGTGLGLSQIYGWIKQSGGHVRIYSELGHGTTIRLYLPRAEGSPRGSAEDSQGVALPGGSEAILVVEDNPDVRATVVRQLASLGYRTVEAADAGAALDRVRAGLDFDLLFTDVIMPGGMSGHQLAAEVRAARPQARVLFTSGYTEQALQERGGAGADAMLSKPYRKTDLAHAVRRALDKEA